MVFGRHLTYILLCSNIASFDFILQNKAEKEVYFYLIIVCQPIHLIMDWSDSSSDDESRHQGNINDDYPGLFEEHPNNQPDRSDNPQPGPSGLNVSTIN